VFLTASTNDMRIEEFEAELTSRRPSYSSAPAGSRSSALPLIRLAFRSRLLRQLSYDTARHVPARR